MNPSFDPLVKQFAYIARNGSLLTPVISAFITQISALLAQLANSFQVTNNVVLNNPFSPNKSSFFYRNGFYHGQNEIYLTTFQHLQTSLSKLNVWLASLVADDAQTTLINTIQSLLARTINFVNAASQISSS